MPLPTERRAPTVKSPKSLVIYGPPKIGKTTLLACLDDFLLVDLEEGSDFVEALKVKLKGFKAHPAEPEERKTKRLENMEMYFSELYTEIVAYQKEYNKLPYLGMIIDTVTELESWCERDATEEYMKMAQGKKFNRRAGVEPLLDNGEINPRSVVAPSQFRNVLTLPNGGGYLHLREAFKKWKGVFDKLAKYKIFVAHVKDIMLEKAGKEVSARDLDLTGKIKNITCGYVDAIGYIYRDSDNPLELRISFKNNDRDIVGSRPSHLRNRDFVIAVNNEDGSIKEHFWDKVYIG